MKIRNSSRLPKRGYAALLTTVTLSLTIMAFAMTAFRGTRQAHRVQSVNQVRLDYSQKERAFLRSLLQIVPNAAMTAMMENSQSSVDDISWEGIFEDALVQARVDQALDPAISADLGISATVISANTGDATFLPSNLVTAPNGSGNFVLPSTASSFPTGMTLPPGLTWTGAGSGTDLTHPVVTFRKALPGSSELYTEMPYPQIAFGYTEQGSTFIAKRNWWAFTLNFGADTEAITGIAPTPRTYVLSIYEVPTQLAVSSSGFTTSLGKFNDGSDWDPAKISITGSVYASKAKVEDLSQFTNVASREGVFLGSSAPSGQSIGGLAERRELEATTNTFYPYSSSSDSGMVSFTAVNRGWDFFDYFADTTLADRTQAYFSDPVSSSTRRDYFSDPTAMNSVSPTGWNEYSLGARQTQMQVEIGRATSSSNQMPNRLFVSARFDNDTITRRQQTSRNAWWRFEGEDGYSQGGQSWPATPDGDDWFVQTEYLPNGRPCLTLDLEKLPAFLTEISADDCTINNSIWIGPKYGVGDVAKPSFPSANDDVALLIKASEDLSAYTNGLTIITPLRVYFADNFNAVPTTPPAGSGITGDWYPPVSVYAPEKRFGIQDTSGAIDIQGQIGVLPSDSVSSEVHPLDLKDGGTDTVDSNSINVNLTSIQQVEDLPPVNSMSWLTVIQEVH
ncbi:hypothetical protein AAFN60_06030 [Roseibacillus persicicus]|uniref:hypothetical protein n=1 Tax=Roseibacillus persicicus TaxID=454148 RepID=UPI00398BB828